MLEIQEFFQRTATGDLLPWKAQKDCAARFGLTLGQAEEAALKAGYLPARYQRNRKTLSTAQQLRLFKSRAAVIGCGGLGGYVVEELARLGVGELVVADPDVFEEHNLNRQLFSSMENLGLPKVRAARERVERINPAVTLTALEKAFDASSAAEILKGCQVAVDALDSIQARLQLARSCSEYGIPLVHGAISGWYGQVALQHPEDDILQRIYDSTPEDKGIETEMGNPSFTPALVASIQVALACRTLLGLEGRGEKGLFYINLLDMQWEELKI